MPVMTGPCQSPQGQQALLRTSGLLRPSPPARVRASSRKSHMTTFLPAQLALEKWHQQDDELQPWSVSLAIRTRIPSGRFFDESFPNADLAFEIMRKKGSDNARLVFQTIVRSGPTVVVPDPQCQWLSTRQGSIDVVEANMGLGPKDQNLALRAMDPPQICGTQTEEGRAPLLARSPGRRLSRTTSREFGLLGDQPFWSFFPTSANVLLRRSCQFSG